LKLAIGGGVDGGEKKEVLLEEVNVGLARQRCLR
jgi:hypothetical protein